MKPLIVLVTVFMVTAATSKILTGNWKLAFSGNFAMFVMLAFTALGHFMFTKGMTMMMPSVIPLKMELVYITGVAEFLLGVSLLIPRFRFVAGILLIALFVLMFPANVHAAVNHINYVKGTYDGSGPAYLWFRIPLQLLFIGWVWFFVVKK